jgi:hypothetical protein
MSNLSISLADVERIQAAAYRMKERAADTPMERETDARMDTLLAFTEVLTGSESVEGFLHFQDMN